MDIFYKRVDIWCKWPWQDEIEESWVEYSLSKRKFNCFLKTPVTLDMKQRTEAVAEHLKRNPKKIHLVKTT